MDTGSKYTQMCAQFTPKKWRNFSKRHFCRIESWSQKSYFFLALNSSFTKVLSFSITLHAQKYYFFSIKFLIHKCLIFLALHSSFTKVLFFSITLHSQKSYFLALHSSFCWTFRRCSRTWRSVWPRMFFSESPSLEWQFCSQRTCWLFPTTPNSTLGELMVLHLFIIVVVSRNNISSKVHDQLKKL